VSTAAAFLAAVFKGAWYVCDCCGTTLKKGRRTRWFLTREAADRAGRDAGWQTAAGRSDSEICPACLEQRSHALPVRAAASGSGKNAALRKHVLDYLRDHPDSEVSIIDGKSAADPQDIPAGES